MVAEGELGVGERARCPVGQLRTEHRDLPERGCDRLELAGRGGEDVRVADAPRRVHEVLERVEAGGRVVDEQDLGAREQAHGGDDLAALQGARPSGGQEPPGPERQGLGVRVGRPEVEPVGPCLFEVVADDLVEIGEPPGTGGLEPVREALVELRPLGLREALVRGVPDEQVTEPVRLVDVELAFAVGPDQLLADERPQLGRDAVAAGLGRELEDLQTAELLPDDRGALDRPPLGVVEAVESCREQRLHRRRDGDARRDRRPPATRPPADPEHAVVEQHLDDLLDVQRIAVRRGGEASPGLRRQRGPVRAARRSGAPSRPAEGARAGRWSRWTCRRSSPDRTSSSSGRAMTSSRTGTLVIQSARCSTRSRRVSSAHWRSSSTMTTGTTRGQPLDEPANGPEQLIPRQRRPADPERLLEALDEGVRLGGAARSAASASRTVAASSASAASTADPQEVGDRQPRDPVAVRQATAAQHRRARSHQRQELVDEPALADPGRPEDGDEDAGLVVDGPLERRRQRGELALAAHHRAADPAWDRLARPGGRRRATSPRRAARDP